MAKRVARAAMRQARPAAPVPAPPQPKARRAKPATTIRPTAPAPQPTGTQLYTPAGARKYLTAAERDAFLAEAARGDRAAQTLCMTLAYSGCRLSEALALTVDRVDLGAGTLVFESLKKRRDGIYRAVPVSPALLEALVMAHGVRELQARRGKGRGIWLWPWSRMTGWRAVHGVMVAAVTAGIPLNLVQKWLGHAQLSTTAIYADAVGAEEKDIARRMWM